MKVLLAIIFISFFTQVDWVKDIENRVENIDENGKEVKSKRKSMSDDSYTYVNSKIKLNKESKLSVSFNCKKSICLTFDYNAYKLGKFIFAIKEYTTEPLFYKELGKKPRAIMQIIETNKYFKNDSVGISYSREIDVFANQNIDSLKIELQKKDFVSTPLNNEDYNKERAKYKGRRKF